MDTYRKLVTLKRKAQMSETLSSGNDDESSDHASSSRSEINATTLITDIKQKKENHLKYDATYLRLGFT